MTVFGIYGDAAVVAYVLLCTGGYVEQRCFAAVGVADKHHVDDVTLVVRFFGSRGMGGQRPHAAHGGFADDGGILHADGLYFYESGFTGAKRYVVA